jgi:hypothetical protein
LAQRLARTSMPLAPTSGAIEAPAVQQEIEAATQQFSDKDRRASMRKKLRLSARF